MTSTSRQRYRFGVEKLNTKPPADAIMVADLLLLLTIGLISLYTASTGFAERFYGDRWHFIRRQLIFLGFSLPLFLVAATLRLELLRRFIKIILPASLILCLLSLIPGLGIEKKGAMRWLGLGFLKFQPSELVKLTLPIYLAHLFAKKADNLTSARSGVLPPLIVVAVFCALIYWQNDFSTSAFIMANALLVFFLAGVRILHFVAIMVLSLPLMFLMVFTKEYRVQRLLSFIRPDLDPMGMAFQVRASIETVASGGLWGKGLGQGTRKIGAVPEIHSDFIFAAFAEEFGFIGVLVMVSLFGLFTVRAFKIAQQTDDEFKRLLVLGLTIMFVSQALLNLAVTVGVVPVTGVPLPLFSSGGSSLTTSLIALGLIVNVSRTINQPGGLYA